MGLVPSFTGLGTKSAYNSTYLYYDVLLPLVNSVPNICANLNETTSQIITCPYKNRSIPALTYDACVNAVTDAGARYSGHDVYDRVLLWRVPLLALWATTTLPEVATGFWSSSQAKGFTLVHLIGDPIDAIYSIIYKLDRAHRSVQWCREEDLMFSSYSFPFQESAEISCGDNSDGTSPAQSRLCQTRDDTKEQKRRILLRRGDSGIRQYYQDVTALLLSTYDEYGLGEEATKAMKCHFRTTRSNNEREALRARCATAAFHIASNRVSRFLPSAASIIQFLVQISAGFWKVLSAIPGDDYDPSNPVSEGLNRAPHNIAFGVLFFWLPMAVMLTAWVGGSQTAHLARDELENIAFDARRLFKSQSHGQRIDEQYEMNYFPAIPSGGNWAYGGLPVWQVDKFWDTFKSSRRRWLFRIFGGGLSVAVVALPTACAISISWLTPSDGFGCRAMTQLAFLLVWIGSASFDWLLVHCKDWLFPGKHLQPEARTRTQLKRIYWIVFAKDFAIMVGTITTLTYTALGIFNKCNCWSAWFPSNTVRYISFSQEPYIFHLIKHRLRYTFSVIAVGAVLAQVVLLIGIMLWFWDGHTVLKQRNIDEVLEGPNWSSRIRSFRLSIAVSQSRSVSIPEETESVALVSLIPKFEDSRSSG